MIATLAAIALSVSAPPVAAKAVGSRHDGLPVGTGDRRAASPDSAEVVALVERFHTALSRGDSATVLSLLAPNAVILESGDLERRAEYRQHHLPADVEFARAVPDARALASVVVHGDVAWVSSTSITQGTMKGRAINSAGAELMVLARRDRHSPWLIRAVHWSSHRRRS
jgi:ketosteroid isomerase-like protein